MEATEFIRRNNLTLNRTQDEIVKYIDESDDFFGFIKEVLCIYLDFDHCKKYLNPDVTEWNHESSLESTAESFINYMSFAWEKANNERGLSAGRSIEKLTAWMWLMGRDDVAAILSDDNLYDPYGKPALAKACEILGLPDESVESWRLR